MISFSCPKCGVRFEVDDELSGARVECSECHEHFNVPAVSPLGSGEGKLDISAELAGFADSAPPVESQAGDGRQPMASTAGRQKMSPRQRRLATDFHLMQERFSTFPLIHLERAVGNPPETYVVSYRIRGIERVMGSQVIFRDYHEVEIKLPGTYPRTPPVCRMLTPVFHPNIEPAIICIGDHWTASEKLPDLVVRIGEMIAYQAHNIKSPLDGEAAMWTDLNADMLPIDGRDLTPPEI